MDPFPKLDQKKLVLAAVIVGVFLIFILSLQLIIPILSIFVAIGIIIAAIYGIWKFLTK